MSKRMGLSFLGSLAPISANHMGQISKLGGKEGVSAAIGSILSPKGIKSWWNGAHLMAEKGGGLSWGLRGSQAMQAQTMSNRRFAVKGGAAILGMNLFVGDQGLLGFGKSTVNTGIQLSAGAAIAKPLWKKSAGMSKGGKFGVRGAIIGATSLWAANKFGII